MFYRNRLLFGIVKTVVSTVWQVLYGLICFLNLQPVLIVLLLWVLLYFTGLTEKYSILMPLLSVMFVLALVYAVLTCIKQLLGLDKKPKKARRGADTVGNNVKKAATPQPDQDSLDRESQTAEQTAREESQTQTAAFTESGKPKYYRVKQNPSLIMAEYYDRYELYKVKDGHLIKLRTDYKS